MSSTTRIETQETPQDLDTVREQLARCAAKLEGLETLPKPYDLYYAVKKEYGFTGWSWACAGIGVTDIRAAVTQIDHLKLEVGRRFAVDEAKAFTAARTAELEALLAETVRDRENYNGMHQAAVIEIDRLKDVAQSLCETIDDYEFEHVNFEPVRAGAARLRDAILCEDEGCPQHGTPHVCVETFTPKINIKLETVDGCVTGSTNLNVIRVEAEDDGSFTAVSDYWPGAQHQVVVSTARFTPLPHPGCAPDEETQMRLASEQDLAPREHVLYETRDADRPDTICDSNGEVVLGLCRRCGRAEVELEEPCSDLVTR